MPRGDNKGNVRNLTRAGMGRPRGSKNRATILRRDILAMVLGALSAIGGQRALERWAREHQTAFMKSVISLIPKDDRIEVSAQPPTPAGKLDLSVLSKEELESLRAIMQKDDEA